MPILPIHRLLPALMLLWSPALLAQETTANSATGEVSFNLFSFEGAYLNRVFRFDAGYTEKYGVPVPVPFVVQVPVRQDVELIADGRPSGGLVKFTFVTKETATRSFIENFHVVDAVFPRAGEGEAAIRTRREGAAAALVNSAFPAAVRGYEQAKLLATNPIDINGISAVQVIGSYFDPTNGPMILHLIALPHPNRDESYFVIHNISQSLVPVSGAQQLPQTLGGRILSSFAYE